MTLPIMYFCLSFCYCHRLRPKRLPQHPTLEHPQPISSQCGRPNFIRRG